MRVLDEGLGRSGLRLSPCRAIVSWVRRAAVTALLMVPFCLLVAPTASADCVGYGSEKERVDTARDRAALVALGTPTAIENYPRPLSGGAAVSVYTFTIDTGIQGVAAGDTVKIAAAQGSSISRTFEIDRRYFLAPSTSDRDSTFGVDLAKLAPYADGACSPTAPLDELSSTFTDQWPASSGVSPTADPSPSAVPPLADGSDGNGGRNLAIGAVVAVVLVGGIGTALIVRRRL